MIKEVKHLVDLYSSSITDAGPDPANSAVIIPLFERDQSLWIMFIRRSENIGLHRGQMGFPGGMEEPGDYGDLLRTALRESHEEVGILPEDVDIAGNLKTRSTIQTGLKVRPFVGIIPWPYSFKPDGLEVQSVHIADLKKMAADVQGIGNRYDLLPPVYPVDDLPVWGLTARMVTELLEVLEPVIG